MNSKHSFFYVAAILALVAAAAAAPRAAFAGGDASSGDPTVDVAPQQTGGTQTGTAPQGTGGTQTGTAPQGLGGTQTGVAPQGTGGTQTSGGSAGSSFYLQNPLSDKFSSVGGLVEGFLEILSYIAVILAVLMLIWTGLQFVMAQGEPKRLNELKTQLLWIVIGVALVIGARIIVTVAVNTLKATGAVSPGTIQSTQNALQGNNP